MLTRSQLEVRRPTAVVATTPDDSHGWNLVALGLELEERGFAVTNLGPCTPAADLAACIRDRRPDLVALSTLNGHGAISLARVLAQLDLYQVRRTAPIVVGGLLTTSPAGEAAARASLARLGVAGIFTGEDAWARFDAWLCRLRAKQLVEVTGSAGSP